MSKFRFVLSALFAVITILTVASITQAQATRTWVSGVGDDANPCSRTAPCKTFAGAISKTAVGGEINCLDAGGFGAVTITKSITIDGTGAMASILASGTNGIIVNIADGGVVRIRGLAINGAGNGINGIRVIAANKVFVENTVIDGFAKHGITVETSAPVQVFVKNTAIRNNSGNGINVSLAANSPTTTLSVDKSYLEANGTGLYNSNESKAIIKDSVVTNNSFGLMAEKAELTVVSCLIGHNTTGIQAGSSSTFRLSDSTVINNDTGLAAAGGTIISFKNNIIYGNKKDGTVTSTIAQQ